jgi:hypothetical protein
MSDEWSRCNASVDAFEYGSKDVRIAFFRRETGTFRNIDGSSLDTRLTWIRLFEDSAYEALCKSMTEEASSLVRESAMR